MKPEFVDWDDLKFDVSHVSSGVIDRIRRKRYEGQTVDRIQALCPTDIPFINFGGGIGVVDCIQSRRMKDPTKHVSVEANPESVIMNARNRDLNGCKYSIFWNALVYETSASFFIPQRETELIMAGSLDTRFEDRGIDGKWVDVPGTSLSRIANLTGWDEFALCVDIEGGEFALFEKEIDLILERCSWLIVEWHYGNEKDDLDNIRSFELKRKLKDGMTFHEEHSISRMSVFSRKKRKRKWFF